MIASNKKGLSLIEVVISIAILSFLMITLTSSWSGNFLRMRKSRLNNNVAQFLEKKIIEIESKYRGRSIDNIPKELSGDFGSEFKSYRWTMESRQFVMPNITSLLVGREEGASEMLLTIVKSSSDFISSSVKEVRVTVYVKIDKTKEAKYSVTTYFVDYTKDLQIGGLQVPKEES